MMLVFIILYVASLGLRRVFQHRPLLLQFVCMLFLCSTAVFAEERRIIGSPIAFPEHMLSKMHAISLPPNTTNAGIRYIADQDSELIRNWLRAEGYLDAQVEAAVENGKAVWRITAGKLWLIRQVEIRPAPPADIQLPKAGDAFHSERYEQGKAALLWSWKDAGYLQASYAKAVVIPDKDSSQVDIFWHIKPELQLYISDIQIEGAVQYSSAMVVKLSRLQAEQVATQERLQQAMTRITNDPRYQSAMIVPELNAISGNHVPLRIIVAETGWKKFTADAGYSTDANFVLGVSWTDRSLQNGELEYSLRSEASNRSAGMGATLLRPAWPESDQKVGVNVDYNRVDSGGRRYEALAVAPFWQLEYRRKDYLRISLKAEDVLEAGVNLLTLGPQIEVHFSDEEGGFIPASGWRLTTSAALPTRVNGPGKWAVTNVVGRLFYQPAQWLILTPRLGYGRTFNLQEKAPKTYRQFAGGATTARGYALDSLGPVAADGLVTGALIKGFAGLDLLFMPDAETFSPLLFVDAAKLWLAPGPEQPQARSWGFGEIIRTPAGPLRMDIALPVQPRPQDAKFQFYITLGEMF